MVIPPRDHHYPMTATDAHSVLEDLTAESYEITRSALKTKRGSAEYKRLTARFLENGRKVAEASAIHNQGCEICRINDRPDEQTCS
jgi:hypothetical protein